MGIHEDPELDFLDNLSQISSVMHPEKIIRDKSYNDLFEYNPVNTKG